MNANETNAATIFGSVQDMYETIIAEVVAKTKGYPPLDFGDLIAKLAHDVDNEQGLAVVNDVGDRWRTWGDGDLDKRNPTSTRGTRRTRPR